MAVTRPTRLKVLGWSWTIAWDDKHPLLPEGIQGLCVYPMRLIVMQPSQPDPRTTLLHEVLHACWWEAGLPEDGEMDLGGLLGEAVVARLAPALRRTLLDSPKLNNYLMEEQ